MSFQVTDTTKSNLAITNDGFFPDLSVEEFQTEHRVSSTYAEITINRRITSAAADINLVLSEFKERLLPDFQTLEDYQNAENIGAVIQYQEAVFFRAKADLLIDYKTFSERDIAENIARDGEETRQQLLTLSNERLKTLQKIKGFATVELI